MRRMINDCPTLWFGSRPCQVDGIDCLDWIVLSCFAYKKNTRLGLELEVGRKGLELDGVCTARLGCISTCIISLEWLLVMI